LTESTLLIWLFVVPAMAALAEYGLGKKFPASAGRVAVVGATMTFGIAILLAFNVYNGAHFSALGHQLRADALTGFVALIITFVGWVTTVFAYPYLRGQVAEGKIALERLPVYFAWSMVFISTMTAATVNNNLIMMYVFVEATTLASAVLVSYYWKPESLEAGYKYLLLCSVGITMGLLGCVVIYSAAVPLLGGHNAMLISEIATVAGKLPPMAVLMAGVLVIIGFGSKAGLVPFHAWLPDTYSQAPIPVTALLSGVASKVAIYAVARIVTMFYPGHSALGMFGIIIGIVSMLVGIILAYQQTDLKRMLAYSSVSQMGYIILGFGLGSYLGLYGAIYHMFNHGLSKAMLFLCCGALVYSFGTTDMRQLGAKKHSRLLTVCYFIGALSIGGMPPLGGFWSKFAIYIAAAQAHLWWPFGIAIFTSLLTLAVMIRAGVLVFMQPSHVGHANNEAHRTAHAEVVKPVLVAAAVAGGGAALQIIPGSSIAADAPVDRRCPVTITFIIVLMAALVIITSFNSGPLSHLIDLSVKALLGQMAGG
jgi:hydrogenase-4 component F